MALPSSFLPSSGSLSAARPLPRTMSGILPSDLAGSFNNQNLGGLLTGTSAQTGGAQSDRVAQVLPQDAGQDVETAASQGISTRIKSTNDTLMSLAQASGAKKRARLEALQRASQQQSGSSSGSGTATAGSSSGYTGGGTALSRVRPLITGGYQITDTYRDAAYNRSVGGVSGSLHMDKGNPAVDIAGSTAALDALYRKLKAMGGWRQLLWRVPGHYDHIHVA